MASSEYSEPAREADIEVLVARCLERLESEGESGVEEELAASPELAERARRRIRELCEVGVLETGSVLPESVPERLGDFVLLEPIGGGAMGLVYRARQESLGREVAVKLVRPDHLGVASIHQRFKREVEVVARLQHPGIVQVYSVGKSRGVPWFAMELIRGCALGEALEKLIGRRPTDLSGADMYAAVCERAGVAPASVPPSPYGGSWTETCTRIALAILRALACAHGEGVLHRDVKPSNVMLGVDGSVKLLDFGLTVSPRSARLTRTGDAVGSPAYMAPEQIRDQRLDPRTDVYAAGVTFYEMLTLELPFLAHSIQEMRERILTGEPVPPRHRNRSVPFDVETVCLHAMDLDPGRRYTSASAFAEDLECLLHHRPIQARRLGRWLRLRRWAQRHPGRAVGVVMGFLLLTAGPTSLWMVEREAGRRIQEEKVRAEGHRARALRAVDQVLAGIASQDLQYYPGLQRVARDYMEQALAVFEEVEAEEGEDVELLDLRSGVLCSLASIHRKLGDWDAALNASERALQAAERMLRSNPTNPRASLLTCRARSSHATVLRHFGRHDDAEAALRAGLVELAALPETAGRLEVESSTRNVLGSVLLGLQRNREALEQYETAIEGYVRLQSGVVARRHLLEDLAHAHNSAALAAIRLGDQDVIESHLEEAESFARELYRTNPDIVGARYELARTLATRARHLDDLEEAMVCQERAVVLLEELTSAHPHHVSLRQYHAFLLSHLGHLQHLNGMDADARTTLERCDRMFESLGDGAPLGVRTQHATALRRLGDTLGDLGERQAGEETLRSAVDLLEEEVGGGGAPDAVLIEHGKNLNALAVLVVESAPDEAERLLQRTRDLYEELVGRNPRSRSFRLGLSKALNNLGVLAHSRGAHDRARSHFEDAVYQKRMLVEQFPEDAYLHSTLASSLANLGGQLADMERSRSLLEEAVLHARRAVEASRQHRQYRFGFVVAHETLLPLLLKAGQYERLFDQAEDVATTLGGKEGPRIAAKYLSIAAGAAGASGSAHEAHRPELAERYAERAVSWLNAAVDAGVRDRAEIFGGAFEALEGRDDYAAVLTRVSR